MTADFSGPEHARRWRRLEAETLHFASSVNDPAAKQIMLNVAHCYRLLAERAEAASDPKRRKAGASFGPTALKTMGAAFDAAWAEIVGNFRGDGDQVQAARIKLADALLSVASDDSRDVEVLKRAALCTMALAYRRR